MDNIIVKEIEIVLDKPRKLRYDLKGLSIIHRIHGNIFEAMSEIEKINPEVFGIVLYAGLAHEDKELTLEKVESLVDLSVMTSLTKPITDALVGNFKTDASEGDNEDKDGKKQK